MRRCCWGIVRHQQAGPLASARLCPPLASCAQLCRVGRAIAGRRLPLPRSLPIRLYSSPARGGRNNGGPRQQLVGALEQARAKARAATQTAIAKLAGSEVLKNPGQVTKVLVVLRKKRMPDEAFALLRRI